MSHCCVLLTWGSAMVLPSSWNGGAGYTVGGKDINLLIEKTKQGRDYVMAEVLGEIAGSHKTIGELRQEYTEENGYDDADEYQKALDKVERKGLKGDGQLYRLEVPKNNKLVKLDNIEINECIKKPSFEVVYLRAGPRERLEDQKRLKGNTHRVLETDFDSGNRSGGETCPG